MTTKSGLQEWHALLAFLVLTVLLTVAINLLPLPPEIVPMLMVLTPAALAVILTAAESSGSGVRALLRKLLEWKINWKWYLIMLGLALLVRLTMSVLALVLGWIPSIGLRGGSAGSFLALAAILLPAAFLEELGWRGYVLPKLLKRMPALYAALLIGVVWGGLHLLLLRPGMMYAGEHPVGLLLELIGLSVVITWLYLQAGENIVITSLFHAAQSFFVIVNEGMGLSQQLWSMAAVYVAFALIMAAVYGVSLKGRPRKGPAVLGAGPRS
jgi:membrane protease YdiL (CAAX protease family)